METLEDKIGYIKSRVSEENYNSIVKFVYDFACTESDIRKFDRTAKEFKDLQASRMDMFMNLMYDRLIRNKELDYLNIETINNSQSIKKIIGRMYDEKK